MRNINLVKLSKASFRLALFLAINCTFLKAAFAACPIEVSANSTTAVSDGGTADCVVSVNSGVTLTTTGTAVTISGSGSTATNSGTITINTSGFGINASGSNVKSITNLGSIYNNGTQASISNANILETFSNSGTISSTGGNGVINNGSLTNLINSGSISGGNQVASAGVYNNNSRTISAITNTGSIVGQYGIKNLSTIVTLNNAQGGNSSTATTTALTYTGNLPTNYNIIVQGLTHYGQLAVTSPSGSSTFGIYSTSVLAKGTYSSVLSGISASNLTGATQGNYNGFNWVLNNSSGSIWDLVVTGALTIDTQASLINTASALQNIYTLQNSVLANSFTYDCALFDKNNVCISAGGRNTAVQAANGLNNTSGLLIAAYRPHMNYRVGAYVDQNLSVNNAGSTVNLGNNTPLIGLFSAWNERLDGTGTEIKVSIAYGQKNTTINRQVVGTSEAGSGSSQLNSQGAQAVAKYGFGVAQNVIVSPYAGIRYTQNNMGGYTESTSSAVTAPLTYSALNTNATTALAGVGASYRLIPQVTAFASVGVETDTNTANGSYSATGVIDLTSVNFNPNPVKTRPTAMVGATYDIERNHRLGLTGIYRQEPYQAVSTTTVMATYTVGL